MGESRKKWKREAVRKKREGRGSSKLLPSKREKRRDYGQPRRAHVQPLSIKHFRHVCTNLKPTALQGNPFAFVPENRSAHKMFGQH